MIEITVPWTENRTEKFKHKENKYLNILQSLQFENPEYKVEQITLVIDVFRGYGKDLAENVGKFFKLKKEIDSVIHNMQKSVISELCELVTNI